jgi:TP901 family phage tail tape measure protein
MAEREIVVSLRLAEGTTREQFRALKGTLIDLREEISANNVALRQNAKEEAAVRAEVAKGAEATEAQKVALQFLKTEREGLKQTSANLALAEGDLKTQLGNTRKELLAADEATARLDRAMRASVVSIQQQRDALSSSEQKTKLLAANAKVLFDEFKKGERSPQVFEAINGALIDTRAELTKNRAALRENQKAQDELNGVVQQSGAATEAQANEIQRLTDERNALKAVNASLLTSEGQLSNTLREVGNDVKGLTETGLRFRDKMAEASLEALKQSGILGQLGARMDFLRSEQERLTQEQVDGKVSAEQYRAAMDKLAREESELSAATTQLNGKVDLLTQEFKDGKITAEQFRQGISSINTSVESVGGGIKQGVTDLKNYALGFVGVVAVAQLAVNALKDIGATVVEFDRGLSNIRALGDEFAGSIERIAQASIELGPKLGVAPVEALKGFEELAKAGLTTEQILTGGLESALTLAAAGEIEVGEAAETTAAALTQFNLAGEQAGLVADLLAKGAAVAQGGVGDLSAALNQSGLVASQFGLTLEETVGGLTAFAQAGLIGSDAGTSFRAALLRLQNPTEESKKLLEQYGIELVNSRGEFIGLSEIAGQLQERLSGLTEEQRGATLATIFGQDAIRVANILYKEGAKGIENYTKTVNDSGFANGVAQEKLNNLSGDVSKLGAAFDALVLSVEKGDGAIATALRNITQGATKLLNILSGTDQALNEAKIGARLGSELDFFERGTERVKSLFGAMTLSSTDFAKRASESINAVKEEVKAAGNDLGKLQVIQAKLNAQVEIAAGDGKSTLILTEQFKVLTAAINRASVAKAEDAKASDVSKDAAEKEGSAIESVSAARARLTAELDTEKKNRDALAATDAAGIELANKNVAALEKQLAALDGKAIKTKADTEAEKAANKVTQERIRLADELTKAEQKRAVDAVADPQQQAVLVATNTRDERVAQAQGDTALLLRIEADYQAELQAIRQKFSDQFLVQQRTSENARISAQVEANQQELDLLVERQNQELLIAAQGGEDLTALVEQQKQERQALTTSIEEGQIALLTAQYEAEYAALDGNLIAQFDRQTQYETDLATLKADFRQQDLDAQLANLAAEQELQDAKVSAAISFGQVLQQLAADGSTAAKIGLAIEKASAAVFVILNLQKELAAINAAAAAQSILDPTAPIRGAVLSTAAKIRAGISLATIAATAIQGFDQGGEVGSGNGTIKQTWGKPIRRRNGDNVLITAKAGEKILNYKQQKRLEEEAGPDVWNRIGLPGSRKLGRTRDTFYDVMGYAGGGTAGNVQQSFIKGGGISLPASQLLLIEQVAEQRAFDFQVSTSIEEIDRVYTRRNTINELSTA